MEARQIGTKLGVVVGEHRQGILKPPGLVGDRLAADPLQAAPGRRVVVGVAADILVAGSRRVDVESEEAPDARQCPQAAVEAGLLAPEQRSRIRVVRRLEYSFRLVVAIGAAVARAAERRRCDRANTLTDLATVIARSGDLARAARLLAMVLVMNMPGIAWIKTVSQFFPSAVGNAWDILAGVYTTPT